MTCATSKYFTAPWSEAGLSPDLYYRDFIEYAVWEDYALLGPRELAPFFKRLPKSGAMLVDGVLRELRTELRSAGLEYQAEEALTFLGALHVNTRRFDLFEDLAGEMGSRQWERITSMGDAALAAGRREIARAVFAAADQPGMHRDYLRQQSRRLLGPPPRPAPRRATHLRIVR